MSHRVKKYKGDVGLICFTIVLILSVALLLFNVTYYIISLNQHESYVFTVTDKNVKYGKSSGKYLIYGTIEDGKILTIENTDEFWYGKFNSSDIYADLKIGNTYQIEVIGFRIPFLSKYQNLIAYQLIE